MPDPLAQIVLMLHALSTGVMAGVIWTMQVVHYPLFARVPADAFRDYERAHMTRITAIVGPSMLVEMLTAAAIVIATPAGVAPAAAWLGLGLLAAIWVSTATTQGPIHRRLAEGGWDARLIARLVGTNWLRTILWSVRAVLALVMLAGAGRG
jgi:hypothetical protein